MTDSPADPRLGAFEPIADGVYRAVAEPASVNIGLVVGDTGALLIDTGSSPAQGRAIRAAAQAVAGAVPLTAVVVTHRHYDHLYGLAAFDDLESWAHAGLAESLDREPPDPAELASLGVQPDEVRTPRRAFRLAATLDLGGCHAEVVHFGRGHTDHDVAVFVPSRDVVFAGDLLEQSGPPSVERGSWPKDWPRTLDGILGTLRPATRVVPGHGDPLDRQGAFIQRAELAFVEAKAEQLHGRGVPIELAWTGSDEWPWPREAVEQAVAVSYARLAEAGRKPGRRLPLL